MCLLCMYGCVCVCVCRSMVERRSLTRVSCACVSPPQQGRAYADGRAHNFRSYRAHADAFKRQWCGGREMSSNEIEQDYWRIVETGVPNVEVSEWVRLFACVSACVRGERMLVCVSARLLTIRPGGVRERPGHDEGRERLRAREGAVRSSSERCAG